MGSNGSCAGNPAESFLAIAYLGPQHQNDTAHPLAWGVAADQPTNPATVVNVAMPLNHTSFDFPLTATVTGIPSAATHASVELSPILKAAFPPLYTQLQQAPPDTFSRSAPFDFLPTPTGIFASYEVTERVDFSGPTTESHIGRRRSYIDPPLKTTFSADALALVAVEPLNVADPIHPQAVWSVSSGPHGDFGKVTLRWTRGTAIYRYSAFFAPDRVTSFRLPDVPEELSSYAPTATSTFTDVAVEYTDQETVNGYAASSVFQTVTPANALGLLFSGGTNQATSH